MRFRLTPYGQLCLSYAAVITAGWLLLMLPVMAKRGPMPAVNALFMSTSVVCVTGLTVQSVGGDFTIVGQIVILSLIQVSGLGFMTLSSSLLMRLRNKVTLGQAAVIHEALGQSGAEDLRRLLGRCMRTVFAVEFVGAVLLFARFSIDVPAGHSWLSHAPNAAWQAVFHAVSAFCNAGFSLWDDSLTRYAGDLWVSIVVGGLIVLGGLGFFVLVDVEEWLRHIRASDPPRLRFQSRVVLRTSLWLVVVGAALIWLGECRNALTIAMRPLTHQAGVSLFQAVTARTAGFSMVNVGAMSHFSLAVLILLMFIGASPGSCGGGVKTTTFAVLFTLATGAFRTGREPNFAGRSFNEVTVRSAIVLFFAAAAIVLGGALFIMFVESAGGPFGETKNVFVGALFEAVSAFATVGLSTGITPELSAASKVCLIVLMYLGRVGPLGLISATLRGRARPEIKYPSEYIQIG